MLRTIVSVLAGFVLWSILWVAANGIAPMVLPDAFDEKGVTTSATVLGGFILLAAVFSVLSGLTTARLKPGDPGKAVAALAGALLVVGIFVEVMYWGLMPVWYHLVFLAVLVPATLWGGRLAR